MVVLYSYEIIIRDLHETHFFINMFGHLFENFVVLVIVKIKFMTSIIFSI